MPPFTYAPFINPYAGSIGDLLEHRGDAAALTARSIGNAVAAVPQQITQETARAAQQGEAGKLQLDDLQARAEVPPDFRSRAPVTRRTTTPTAR
jgi:hypothetical protein